MQQYPIRENIRIMIVMYSSRFFSLFWYLVVTGSYKLLATSQSPTSEVPSVYSNADGSIPENIYHEIADNPQSFLAKKNHLFSILSRKSEETTSEDQVEPQESAIDGISISLLAIDMEWYILFEWNRWSCTVEKISSIISLLICAFRKGFSIIFLKLALSLFDHNRDKPILRFGIM